MLVGRPGCTVHPHDGADRDPARFVAGITGQPGSRSGPGSRDRRSGANRVPAAGRGRTRSEGRGAFAAKNAMTIVSGDCHGDTVF